MHFTGKSLKNYCKPKTRFKKNKTTSWFESAQLKLVVGQLNSTSKLAQQSQANNKLLNQNLIKILQLLLVETRSTQQGLPGAKLCLETNEKLSLQNNKKGLSKASLLNFQSIGLQATLVNHNMQSLKPLYFVQNVIYKSCGKFVSATQLPSSINKLNYNLNTKNQGTTRDRSKQPSQASLTYLNFYYFHGQKNLDFLQAPLVNLNHSIVLDKKDQPFAFQDWVVKPTSRTNLGKFNGFIQKRSFLSYWIIPIVGFYTFVVNSGTGSKGFASFPQNSWATDAFRFTSSACKPKQGYFLFPENEIMDSNCISAESLLNSTQLPLEKIWFTSQTTQPFLLEKNDSKDIKAFNSFKSPNYLTQLKSENFVQKELAKLTMDELLTPLKGSDISNHNFSSNPTKSINLDAVFAAHKYKLAQPTKSGFGFFCCAYWNQLDQFTEFKSINQDFSNKLEFKQSVNPLTSKYLYSLKTTFFTAYKFACKPSSLELSLAKPSLLELKEQETQLIQKSFIDSIEKTKTSLLGLIKSTTPLGLSKNFAVTSQLNFIGAERMSPAKQNYQNQFVFISNAATNHSKDLSKTSNLNKSLSTWSPTKAWKHSAQQEKNLGLKALLLNTEAPLFVERAQLNLTPVTNSKKIIKFLETLITTYNWDLAKNIYNLNPQSNGLALQATATEGLSSAGTAEAKQVLNQQVNLQNIALKQNIKSSLLSADTVKTTYIVNLLKSKSNVEHLSSGLVANLKSSSWFPSAKRAEEKPVFKRAFKTNSDSIYCFLSLNNKGVGIKQSIHNIGFTPAAEANTNIIKLQTPILTATRLVYKQTCKPLKNVTKVNPSTISTQPLITTYTLGSKSVFQGERENSAKGGSNVFRAAEALDQKTNTGLINFDPLENNSFNNSYSTTFQFTPQNRSSLKAKNNYYTSNSFNNYMNYIQYKLTKFISVKTTNLFSVGFTPLQVKQGKDVGVDNSNLLLTQSLKNRKSKSDNYRFKSSIFSAKSILKHYLPTKNSFALLKENSQSKLESLDTKILQSGFEKANLGLKPLNLTKNIRIVLEHKKMFVCKSLRNNLSLQHAMDGVALEKARAANNLSLLPELKASTLFSKTNPLMQEPFMGLDHTKESLSLLQAKHESQKKHKAHKQRLEGKRQKKRKRFHPRPTWFRLRLSRIVEFSNLNGVKPFNPGVKSQPLLNKKGNSIQDVVFNLQKSKSLLGRSLNTNLQNIPYNLALAKMRSKNLKNSLNLKDFNSLKISNIITNQPFVPLQKCAAFRLQINSHKENSFENLLQNSKKLKNLTSKSNISQNLKTSLGNQQAYSIRNIKMSGRESNNYLYTEYVYNNKLFVGKKLILELKNTNGKNYVNFERQSTNPAPNSNKTNNNSFRDFWIWLYDLTSTNNWNRNLALNNIIPNLPISIQNVKLKSTKPLQQAVDVLNKDTSPPQQGTKKQGFGENQSFNLLNKTPKKNIQFRTNANFKSLNWALNKTNLWSSNTQRLNLWSTQKLHYQSKINKTKYLEKQIKSTINSGFSSLYLKSFLTKNNNNYFKFKISQKLHNKEHKLAYLESSFYNQNTKGKGFNAHRNKLSTRSMSLQPRVAKPTLYLAWWAGLDMSWLNSTNDSTGELFISPSNLGQDIKTTTFSSVDCSLPSSATREIEFFKQSLKSNFLLAFNSVKSPYSALKENNFTELTIVFAMHFCALISLLSISQIRSFIKFHLILLHKLSNGYLQLIYKNFAAHLTTVKAFNFVNSSMFKTGLSFSFPAGALQNVKAFNEVKSHKATSVLLKQNRKLLNFGFTSNKQKSLLVPGLTNNASVMREYDRFSNLSETANSITNSSNNINNFGKSKKQDSLNTRVLGAKKSLLLKQRFTKVDFFSLAKPTVLKTIYGFAKGFGEKPVKPIFKSPLREINLARPIYSIYSSLQPSIQPKIVKLSLQQELNDKMISNRKQRLTFLQQSVFAKRNIGLGLKAKLLNSKENQPSKKLKTETLADSINLQSPKINLSSISTFIKFFQQLVLFIALKQTELKKSPQLKASKNLTAKAINVNSLSSQIVLTEITSQTIKNIQKTALNTSYKVVDTFEYFLRIIYSFFEKPAELTMDWIAYAFLVEWSSDFLTFTPEKGEKQTWLAFSKWARHTKISNTLASNSIITATLNLTVGQFLYKRVLYFNDQLLEIINRPDTDLMNRQKKGMLFWDIWSDVLIKAADKYNINVPSLSNIKEEQNLLIDKFLGDNLNTTKRLPVVKTGQSNNNERSTIKKTFDGIDKVKSQGFIGSNSSLEEFFLLTKLKAKTIQTRHTRVNFKNIDSISDYFELANGNGVDLSKQKQVSAEGPNEFANFELLKKSTQDINQFVTYQSKETDLFLDYHPPKSFAHISAIRYYTLVQQPLGTLVCQIYSGLLTKQIAKNVLVIGSTLSSNTNTALERTQKTLLIQALAGETEIKIITDNASRYAVVNRGFAVGIKLLKDVFEAIALNTPCLFLLEDIHLIGERRPLLISDTGADSGSGDELSKATENTFGAQRNGEAVHEKNQVLYQLNRHGITHYKKPFKGDFSLSIPTNHFAFDLFLKSRYTNYSETPTHPFAYSLGSLDIDKISGANNPGQNTQTAEFSLTNKLQKLTSKRSSSNSNFETTNTGQFLSSSLQYGLNSLNKLLSPPSTSPFTVLLLKEQKKLKPKRIVKELPWVGLSSSEQQLGLAPAARVSYSVRAKIAALADLGFTNMSAKLDMITDLLVIIDSVRGNRGFVVFATTHLPHTLDPALRRPGRLDETISIPTLSNIWTRWEFTKGTPPIFTNHFALEKPYTFSNNKLELFKAASQSKGVQQLFNNFTYSSQHLVKYYGSIDKLDFINLDFVSNNNNNVLSSIVNGYKQLALNQNLKSTTYQVSFKTSFPARLAPEGQEHSETIRLNSLNSNSSGSKKIKMLNPNSRNLAFNPGGVKSIYTTHNTKRIKQMGQIAYHQIGKKLITNQYSFNLSSLTSIYNNPTTYDSTLALTETSEYLLNQSQYSSLYSSPELIKKTLVCLLSGKLSEQFSVSNFALTLNPRLELNNNVQNSNPFKAAPLHLGDKVSKQSLETKEQTSNLLTQNRKNFLCNTLYGIDQTWRAATSLALSFVQKRYLYNKNLIIPKLMNFTNYTPLEEPPSPPTSNILIPAKRYENAKKALKENIEQKVTRSIQEKLEAHTKQSYIKRIYQKNNSLLNANNKQLNVTSATQLISLETSNNPLTQITSSYVVYENKIVKRHRNYLTNQWWNGQLTEHSSETLFLSDIDWRYTFIDNLNSPILSQNKNLFFNKLRSASTLSKTTLTEGNSLLVQQGEGKVLTGISNGFTKESIKTTIQSQDIIIDFPDADQSYNPKNRRWILTSGDWDSWFNFDKKLQTEIFQHLISECIVQSFILFDKNRELLDYAAANYMKKGLLKNQNLTVAFKKFA